MSRDFKQPEYFQPFYARSKPGYIGTGLQMLQRAIKRRGLGVAADVVASVYEASEARVIAKTYPNKRVIVGGIGAFAPYEIKKHLPTAVVVLGDYGDFLEHGLESKSVFTTPKNTVICTKVSWEDAKEPLILDDGSKTFYLSVGCKMKCGFCLPASTMPFEQNPHDGTATHLITNMLSANKYNYNPPTYYSDIFHKLDWQTKSFLRTGIEGVSERIRTAIGKPISHADLCDRVAARMRLRHKTRLFYIAGMPFETAADWEELRDAIKYWSCIGGGLTQLKLTAYQPTPYVPIGCLPYTDDYYNYMHDLKSWFLKTLGSPHIDFTLGFQPKNRDRNAVIAWGGPINQPSPYADIGGIDKRRWPTIVDRYKRWMGAA